MKKAVSMALALVLTVAAMPVQRISAAEDVLLIDEQEAAPLAEEGLEPATAEKTEVTTDMYSSKIEFIEDDSAYAENAEESSAYESEKTETNSITETESDINARQETEQETNIAPGTEENPNPEEELIWDMEEYGDILEVDAAVEEKQNDEGFTYVLLDDGTVEITGYTGEQSGDLIIPNVIDGSVVTQIGDNAFRGMNGFNGKLELPEGLTSIEYCAFSGCSGFTGELKLPERLTKIGEGAFEGCSSFAGCLRIPDGLTSIGDSAFSGCSSFTGSLELPEGLTSIGDSVFFGCSGFTGSLKLPGTLTSIGDWAFYNCSGFTGNLELPEGITSIGDCAFYNCSGFTGNLELPEGITSIGDCAFSGCSGFTGSLKLPERITSIGDGAFYNCSGFTGNLELPEGITSIGNDVFWGCDRFTGELNLPKRITSIGDGAFFACCGFTGELNLPEGITSIGAAAFSFCDGFTGILKLPEGLISIGNEAFNNCSGFTGNLELPKGIISIGTCAFDDCRGLTGDIILPQSIETIGDYAFSHSEDVIGNFILPRIPTNMGDYVLGGEEYISKNIKINIGTELKIGQTRQGEIILGGMRLSAPVVKKWSSSNEEIAKIGEDGLITAVSVGAVIIQVELYNGISCEALLNIVDEDAGNNVLYTSPEIEKFQDLWVGDQVSIGIKYYFGANHNLSSLDIISGEQCVSVEENGEKGNKHWLLTCKEIGEVNLLIKFNNDTLEPVSLKLIIREKPETEVKFEQKTIKLGGRISTLFENVSYGSYPDVYVNADDAEKFEIHGKRGSMAFDDFFCEERHKERTIILYQASWYDGTKFITSVSGAVHPGTINLLFYPYWGQFEAGKEPAKVFPVVIEEPIISQNAKETYNMGEAEDFCVSLENTDYKDEPLSYIKDGVLMTPTGRVSWIYYIPKFEVLSGKDCIELIGETQVTTLTLKQKMRFKKAGTVKLRVSFEPSGVNAPVNNVYRPEKIITIQVKPENVTAVFDSAGGSMVANQVIPSGNCIEKPDIPTKTGYKFLGWYQGNAEFDFNKPITENVTLTAQWERVNVEVTSVKLSKDTLRLKCGQTYKLAITINPSNATNKAVIWSTSNKKVATVSEGKVTAKRLGTATITAKATDGSGVLASCKVIVGYGIKYQLKGGKNNSKNPAVYYKENISLKHPTRKGYLFEGWYTDKNYSKKITKITKKYKRNLILYAKWEKVSVGKVTISTLKNVSGKKISLKYKAVNKVAGYEILYSTNSKFKKNCNTIMTKKKALTMKGLAKKKTYYVKVRAYKVDSTGAKVYGKYSSVKKVKIAR